MSFIRIRLRLAVAALASVVACAHPASSIVLHDGYANVDSIALGNSAPYSGVGQVFAVNNGSNTFGSGVLIAPQWVLTAGHLTDPAVSLRFWTDSGGNNPSRSGAIFADRWVTHPGFNSGSLGLGLDIGLIHLSSAAPCLAAATCQVAERYRGTDVLGRTATMVGYGQTGTGSSGITGFDGLKRAGQNNIDAVLGGTTIPGSVLIADFDSGLVADNEVGSEAQLAFESLFAPGDSGGGLFEVIGGIEYLVGVASFFGANDGTANADYGDLNGWTRLSDFNAWIDATIPEPASLALLGLGLLAAGAARRPKQR